MQTASLSWYFLPALARHFRERPEETSVRNEQGKQTRVEAIVVKLRRKKPSYKCLRTVVALSTLVQVVLYTCMLVHFCPLGLANVDVLKQSVQNYFLEELHVTMDASKRQQYAAEVRLHRQLQTISSSIEQMRQRLVHVASEADVYFSNLSITIDALLQKHRHALSLARERIANAKPVPPEILDELLNLQDTGSPMQKRYQGLILNATLLETGLQRLESNVTANIQPYERTLTSMLEQQAPLDMKVEKQIKAIRLLFEKECRLHNLSFINASYCYYVTLVEKTWHEAKAYCNESFAYLATTTRSFYSDPQVLQVLRKLNQTFWTGLYDKSYLTMANSSACPERNLAFVNPHVGYDYGDQYLDELRQMCEVNKFCAVWSDYSGDSPFHDCGEKFPFLCMLKL